MEGLPFNQRIVEITFFKDKALSVSDHALSALELLTADVDTAAFQYMKGGFKNEKAIPKLRQGQIMIPVIIS